MLCCFDFVFVLGVMPSTAQELLLAWHSGVTPGGLWGDQILCLL